MDQVIRAFLGLALAVSAYGSMMEFPVTPKHLEHDWDAFAISGHRLQEGASFHVIRFVRANDPLGGNAQNAAFLYYRAMWVLEQPRLVALDLDNPDTVTPTKREQYLSRTETMSQFLQIAGDLNRCDWGLEVETNETGYGVVGLVDRLRTLAYLADQRFAFAMLEPKPPDDAEADLTASLNVARHLAKNPPLFINDAMQAGIIARTLEVAAENWGRLSDRQRTYFADFIVKHRRSWRCDLPSGIAGEMKYAHAQLAALRTTPPLSKNLLIKKLLSRCLLRVPPECAAKSAKDILAAANTSLDKLRSLAPLYRTNSYDRLAAAVRRQKAELNPPLSVALWLHLFQSAWKTGRQTEIIQDMFLAGLQAIRPGNTVDAAQFAALRQRYKVTQKPDGFELKDTSIPDAAAVVLKFSLR